MNSEASKLHAPRRFPVVMLLGALVGLYAVAVLVDGYLTARAAGRGLPQFFLQRVIEPVSKLPTKKPFGSH